MSSLFVNAVAVVPFSTHVQIDGRNGFDLESASQFQQVIANRFDYEQTEDRANIEEPKHFGAHMNRKTALPFSSPLALAVGQIHGDPTFGNRTPCIHSF
jgi:hypothetical protein